MAEISVIVPVYKVEPYICRCVDSILGQTFRDFQLILVDDGSPDSCGSICDAYAEKDSRIHVIHQKNGGLSAARNAGLDWMFANSRSSWVTFVDSDDWIHPEMLERLLCAVQQTGTEVSVCGYAQTSGEDPQVCGSQVTVWDAADFYCANTPNATVAWGKLYHSSCFLSARYPVGKLHEDEFLTYRILFEREKLAYCPDPLYAYYVNPQGITKRSWNPRRLDAWEAYEEQLQYFAERKDEKMVQFCFLQYLWNAKWQLQEAKQSGAGSRHAGQLRRIRRHIRALLRRAGKLGYRQIVSEYRNCVREDLLNLPFVWKAALEKRLEKK